MLSTDPLRTNRDLYLYIAALVEAQKGSQRTLEDYLRTLWHLGSVHADQASIALGDFAHLLHEAFEKRVPAVGSGQGRLRPHPDGEGFEAWEQVIHVQIGDLRAMAESGALDDDMRYFGIDAPSGARWYNFDPRTYLECAAAGSVGGWQPGDDTGRQYVPGKVAVIGEDGQITSAEPWELDNPIHELAAVTWDDFAEFLHAGQSYE